MITHFLTRFLGGWGGACRGGGGVGRGLLGLPEGDFLLGLLGSRPLESFLFSIIDSWSRTKKWKHSLSMYWAPASPMPGTTTSPPPPCLRCWSSRDLQLVADQWKIIMTNLNIESEWERKRKRKREWERERERYLPPEHVLDDVGGLFWRCRVGKRFFANRNEVAHLVCQKLKDTYVICLCSSCTHTQMLITCAQIYSFQDQFCLKTIISLLVDISWKKFYWELENWQLKLTSEGFCIDISLMTSLEHTFSRYLRPFS